MNIIPCPKCDAGWDVDNYDSCGACGERNIIVPQNLVQPDAYSLLAEVRALKETIEAYKECFEKYIPVDKWDEATIFLSTYGSGLAKDILWKES